MALSTMELQWGYSGFFSPTYVKTNPNKMGQWSLRHRAATFYLQAQTRSRCRCHTHLMNHSCFDHWKNPKYPNYWSPMPGGKWRRFLNLRSKSVGTTYRSNWPCLLMCPHNGIKHKAAITVLNVCLLSIIAATCLFCVVGILTNMAVKFLIG